MEKKVSVVDKVTILFYVVGIGMLLWAAKLWIDNSSMVKSTQQVSGNQLHEPHYATQEVFDVQSLISSKEFSFIKNSVELKKDGLIALYVLTTDVCSSCIAELFLYSRLLDEYGVAGKPIQQLVVVVGENFDIARRFIMTSDMSQPAGHYYDKEYINILLNFRGRKIPGQLLFVDSKTDQLFYRVVLSASYGAENQERLDILFNAEEAYREL